MKEIKINEISYLPDFKTELINDEMIKDCIKELVNIQYFKIKHKTRAYAWDALNALSEYMCELITNDDSIAELISIYVQEIDTIEVDKNMIIDNLKINGIEFKPSTKETEVKIKSLKECISYLAKIQYFNNEDDNILLSFKALESLSPKIAKMTMENNNKAMIYVENEDFIF